jgi:hypothetical protein
MTLFFYVGMALMGFTYGPLGTFLVGIISTCVIQVRRWHLIWQESSGQHP